MTPKIPELSHWSSVELKQRYDNSCVPTGYEWLIQYNGLGSSLLGIRDFQQAFNLGPRNCFPNVQKEIVEILGYKGKAISEFISRIKTKSFPTTKEGWQERLDFIKGLLERDVACIMPVPVGNNWHIMPVIRLEKDFIWLLRENADGCKRIDILELKAIRRNFINEEGGEDLAWIEPKEVKKKRFWERGKK
jgi:hypothetical protein